MESRIYGGKIAIDPCRVNTFFEQRACGDNPLASVMVRPASDDGIAEKRNANEAALVRALLGGRGLLRVLDLGCGAGRWVANLEGRILSYAGVDFTEQYIRAAGNAYADRKEVTFHHRPVTDLPRAVAERRYDLVIVNGLCVYLNDEDVEIVLDYAGALLAEGGLLYFRESVATIGERLTLKEFFSRELQTEYNAVYRTPEEYELMFADKLPAFSTLSSGYLLDESTGAYKETNQKHWLLEKAPA
ncbi:MAG: class I SAM-dependent methyltransferase [Desulfovibrio sp.]|nr:class I SAM-dependent methyltransferase [Desulfovibrio sp.]